MLGKPYYDIALLIPPHIPTPTRVVFSRTSQAVLPPCMRADERERSYAKSVSVPRSLDSRCHAACRLIRRPPCTRMYSVRPRPSTPSTPTSRDVRSHEITHPVQSDHSFCNQITPPACTRSLVLLVDRLRHAREVLGAQLVDGHDQAHLDSHAQGRPGSARDWPQCHRVSLRVRLTGLGW